MGRRKHLFGRVHLERTKPKSIPEMYCTWREGLLLLPPSQANVKPSEREKGFIMSPVPDSSAAAEAAAWGPFKGEKLFHTPPLPPPPVLEGSKDKRTPFLPSFLPLI